MLVRGTTTTIFWAADMKIISFATIALGLVALCFGGYGFFVSGTIELLPAFVAGIAVLVGVVGLRVKAALDRISELESAIRDQQSQAASLTEQLRNEGLLSATADKATDKEIDAILD